MERTQVQSPTYLTPQEAAERLGLARTAVDELVSSGQLPSTRYSQRRVRIPAAELEKFIAARTVLAPDPADGPDAAARAAAMAAAIRRRARMRWEGYPDPSPALQLPAGMRVGPDGTLKIG